MYTKLGINWATTVLAFITSACAPRCRFLNALWQAIGARSRYAPSIRELGVSLFVADDVSSFPTATLSTFLSRQLDPFFAGLC